MLFRLAGQITNASSNAFNIKEVFVPSGNNQTKNVNLKERLRQSSDYLAKPWN